MSTPTDKLVTILLVEDQDDMALLTSLYLKKAGYYVERAIHGQKALELLDSGFVPDLILLDVMMPVMNGYEFLGVFNNNEALRHIPVVMLTSLANASDVLKAVKRGALDYCVKPIDPNELITTVNRLLEERR